MLPPTVFIISTVAFFLYRSTQHIKTTSRIRSSPAFESDVAHRRPISNLCAPFLDSDLSLSICCHIIHSPCAEGWLTDLGLDWTRSIHALVLFWEEFNRLNTHGSEQTCTGHNNRVRIRLSQHTLVDVAGSSQYSAFHLYIYQTSCDTYDPPPTLSPTFPPFCFSTLSPSSQLAHLQKHAPRSLLKFSSPIHYRVLLPYTLLLLPTRL